MTVGNAPSALFRDGEIIAGHRVSQIAAMSQVQDTNMDKKEIADEEREKMLNMENTKHTSAAAPVPAENEVEEPKPKKKIPIGGIKMPMPSFCRSKSKETCNAKIVSTCTLHTSYWMRISV